MLQENPNLAVQPDFTLQEHQLARHQLVDGGFTDDQAARSLAALWTLANKADKEQWNLRQERLQEAREREEEEEEQHQQLRQEEAEAARLEDRKKNKNKYVLLVRGKGAPSVTNSVLYGSPDPHNIPYKTGQRTMGRSYVYPRC
ncbi:hypothetical protein P692DRAFT_20878597 [Suillus brevipes Sb2]|nr:hypothetical protein P692DRAFT_20878597 [Suillus brevipes Sb2]